MGNMRILCVLLLMLGLGGSLSSLTVDEFSNTRNNESLVVETENGTVVSSGGPEFYIVGGAEAERNEFPWLVNIRIGSSFCGGSLIGVNLVLTAAHCLVTDTGSPVSPSKVKVTAGDHNLDQNDGTEQKATAAAIKVHEQYNREKLKNDIALIRLNKNLKIVPNVVSPIALQYSTNDSGTYGTVAGWGSRYFGGSVTPVLYKVQVPIVTDNWCSLQMTNTVGQLCAGATNRDSCQGDSGGPLICVNTPALMAASVISILCQFNSI